MFFQAKMNFFSLRDIESESKFQSEYRHRIFHKEGSVSEWVAVSVHMACVYERKSEREGECVCVCVW